MFTRDDGLVRGARGLAHPTPHSSSTNNIANLYGAAGDGRNAGPPGSGASAADRLTAAFGAIGVADRDELPSRSATAPLLPFENGGFGNHRAASGGGDSVAAPARQSSGGAPPFPGGGEFGNGGGLHPAGSSHVSETAIGAMHANANPYAAAQMAQQQQMAQMLSLIHI